MLVNDFPKHVFELTKAAFGLTGHYPPDSIP